MSAFKWREAYSVGINKIDEQHQMLISIINDLYDAHKQGTSQVVIDDVLENLVNYTNYHFSMEEDLISQYNYPAGEDHKNEHREFVERISDLKEESKRGKLLLSLKTIDFLKDWTITHILGTDRDFGEFLQEQELG